MTFYSKKKTYKKREEENMIIKTMKFIQWSNYNDGISLIFTACGVLIIVLFSIFSLLDKNNYIVLAIGSVLCVIGLLLHFFDKKSK